MLLQCSVVGEMSPHELDDSPSSSPQEGRESISPNADVTPVKPSVFNSGLLNGSIFPQINGTETLFSKLKQKSTDSLLATAGIDVNSQNHWLAAWLANNPFAAQFGITGIPAQLLAGENNAALTLKGEGTGVRSENDEKFAKDDGELDDTLEINTPDETNESAAVSEGGKLTPKKEETKASSHGSSLDSLLERKGLSVVHCNNVTNSGNRNKRKATKPQQLSNLVITSTTSTSMDGEEEEYIGPPRKLNAADSEVKIEGSPVQLSCGEQPSPTVSDSHTSGSSAPSGIDVSGSPQKCFHCQVVKAKLGITETRNRLLESKVECQESKIGRLENQASGLQSTIRQYERDQRDLRHHIETFEGKLLECQERAVAALSLLHKGPESLPAVKVLMENLLECTNLTFRNGKQC
ncbi:hypothetical protein AB6A40_008424 [Gnathostoma spinigerum]|uniref:Uncharacterized protein n=1 Tax=Gnathostoma spinigerum TaxID=75299 RepID=A0ABD6EQA7_9BILA